MRVGYQNERLNFRNRESFSFCSALSKTVEAKKFLTGCGTSLRGAIEDLSTECEGNSIVPAE